jgi:hypothetical protein
MDIVDMAIHPVACQKSDMEIATSEIPKS